MLCFDYPTIFNSLCFLHVNFDLEHLTSNLKQFSLLLKFRFNFCVHDVKRTSRRLITELLV